MALREPKPAGLARMNPADFLRVQRACRAFQRAARPLWKPIFDFNMRLIQPRFRIGYCRTSRHSVDLGEFSRTTCDGSDCCGCEIALFGTLHRNKGASRKKFV